MHRQPASVSVSPIKAARGVKVAGKGKIVVLCIVIPAALAVLAKRDPTPALSPAPPDKPWLTELASEHHPPPTNPLDDATKQQNWIAASEIGIRKHLKDPDSAGFRSVFFSTFEGHPVVCGQVNSKNGFGGYHGYQRFIAAGDVLDVLQEEMAPGEFVKSWNLMCTHPRSAANP
jgi:hypothetical protein